MYTIQAMLAGSLRYYKCASLADAEALLQAFAVARIEANFAA
jgi:hypothetical protein